MFAKTLPARFKTTITGLLLAIAPTVSVGAIGEIGELEKHNILHRNTIPEAVNPELPATPEQFSTLQSTVSGGRATASGLKLRSSVGRAFSFQSPEFLFGDEITPPVTDVDGNDLVVKPADYWRAEPLQPGEEVKVKNGNSSTSITPVDANASIRYHYSRHADTVYASQEGRVTLVWRTRLPIDSSDNTFGVLTTSHSVSISSRADSRTIYWTEGRYTGPSVSVPVGLVQELDIVHNSNYPERVDEADAVLPPAAENAPIETKTLWFDASTHVLRASNIEGRVLVEYLGAARGAEGSGLRESLGVEVVDIKLETFPVQVTTYLGERILPKPDGETTDSLIDELTPSQVNAVSLDEGFTQQHLLEGKTAVYAVRENVDPLQVQFYWMEEGLRGVLWPTYLNSYQLIWPSDPAEFHAEFARPANSDNSADSFVALPRGNTPELVYQDDEDANEASLDFQSRFFVDLSNGDDLQNYSLLRFTSGNDFWYVRVRTALESVIGDRDGSNEIDLQETAVVGQRIQNPVGTDSVTGYIDSEYGDAYNPNAYINPFDDGGIENAINGAIIPVNALTDNNKLRVWWFDRLDPPDGLEAVFESLYWPSTVAEYTLEYPTESPELIMASNEGTGELESEQSSGSIYVQNDPTEAGYNPNEEHAMMIAGRGYALRDDLNISDVSSEPFVLIDYTAGDGRPAMLSFKVLRETLDTPFQYTATAGTLLQAPLPLPLLPLPLLDSGQSKNYEVETSDPDVPVNEASLAAQPHYDKFTYEDRKGQKWIYRGPHNDGAFQDTGEAILPVEYSLAMRYFYPTQPGFAFPSSNDGSDLAPDIGTIVPYMRAYTNGTDDTEGYVGDPITGDAIDVTYIPAWPENVPTLHFSETLALPKFGLPQVRGQSSIQVIYEQSETIATADEGEVSTEVGTGSVILHDPTRNKTFELQEAGSELDAIPASIATTVSAGNTFFQDLPTHLQERIYLDPNLGTKGALVFTGLFVDEIAGEDYFLLNVLSDSELSVVKALCDDSDERKAKWDSAIESLSAEVERFIENPDVRGTYISDPNFTPTAFTANQLIELSRPPARPETSGSDDLGFYDEPVDSYALTAVGGGSGYVTLLTGNGQAFTPDGDPVSLHIIKVGEELYRGELKPVTSSNPLSENVTIQHTGDFAAKTDQFEFEWRKAPPVNGLSPDVHEFVHAEIATSSNLYTIERGNPQTQTTLPAQLTINTSDGDTELVLSTELELGTSTPDNAEVSAIYFGLTHGLHDHVQVWVNEILAIDSQADTTASGLPSDITAIMTGDEPVTAIYSIPIRFFSKVARNDITLVFTSDADDDTVSEIDLRVAATFNEDVTDSTYIFLAQEEGKNRHLVAGAGIDTLADNYYIMRYRPLEGHALYPEGGYTDDNPGWNTWTAPALVEGWIKRVLAGINPFNQRVTDFFDNAVNTNVSVITQAGTRWEGDVALNLDAVQDAGLIEIYETVLKRGIDLSINGTPEVDYAPANDALLLAAGYLADLYQILGDEAFADAANPMILFDTQAVGTITDASTAAGFEETFRTTETARFAFQGQVSSLLEEELHLLRGRDDTLAPGIEINPAYNRLFWNYTRGIEAGEVIYALNYNITETDVGTADGKIDAADAQAQFPQGHGDAYGHYLTSLSYYYRLLTDEQFTWGTRSEAVNILGQPVSVDYLDERKFATAAASLARTAKQIQSLEHRKAAQDEPENGWSHLTETKENSSTGRIRTWNLDDWSSRGGQGAYYHWITANAILPGEDTVNEGIQKIDRTTVPELDEIAACAAAIQRRADAANLKLNPLNLTRDSLVFDISPDELANGKTHYEQIHDRAVKALQNAFNVFDRATDSSLFLRSLEEQSENINEAIVDQEGAFEKALIGVYGVPYAGDLGAGKTYDEGYAGPDFFRFMYIDRPFAIESSANLFFDTTDSVTSSKTFILSAKDSNLIDSFDDALNFTTIATDATDSRTIEYTVTEGGAYQFATADMGRRPSLGTIQDALADVRLAEEQLYAGLNSMQDARTKFLRLLGDFEKDIENRTAISTVKNTLTGAKTINQEIRAAVKAIREAFSLTEQTLQEISDAAVSSLPTVNGLSNDATSIARGGLLVAKVSSTKPITAADIAAAKVEAVADAVFLAAEIATEITVLGLEEDDFFRSKSEHLKSLYSSARSGLRNVDALQVAHTRAIERYRNALAEGETILAEREVYRKRASAVIQGARTRDVAFRAFRTEALEEYQDLLDIAAKYTYLAAQAYDYETGLLSSDEGRSFLGGIVSSRALGLLNDDGSPAFAASELGDPGLSGHLAKLASDWEVVQGRLGFNNPDENGTTFSLREEYFRIPAGPEGNIQWMEKLNQLVQDNLLADADIAAHALQLENSAGTSALGIVIPFPTQITDGLNFFGLPLAAGDHRFTETNFATKIHSVGVILEDYKGMDPCLVCINREDDTSDHENALSATPHVYLIPTGADLISSPPIADNVTDRKWFVLDHALPLPYDIGAVGSETIPGGKFLAARKHPSFRAVGTEEFFAHSNSQEYTNSRLVGRSAANTEWKLVIPANELLNDPQEGIKRFINSVSDIKIHMKTYSYAGN